MKRRAEESQEAKKRLDERADEAGLDSFPASDPPGYAAIAIGAPRRDEKAEARPARRARSLARAHVEPD